MILIAGVAAAVAVGTWLVGWWAVVPVSIIAGVLYRDEGGRSLRVAAAAAIGWALLLAIDAVAGPIGLLTTLLGGTIGIPGPVLLVVTLVFPAVLAWSSATAAAELIRPSPAAPVAD
jgi:hypothetical protein